MDGVGEMQLHPCRVPSRLGTEGWSSLSRTPSPGVITPGQARGETAPAGHSQGLSQCFLPQ